MRFRKPWLGVKPVNFEFGAKLLSNDYNESNKPNLKSLAHAGSEKSLAHAGSEKSLVELAFQKMNFFTFFAFFFQLKTLLFTLRYS